MSTNRCNERVGNLKIAYIGGGSRGWARVLMSDLAAEGALGGSVFLYDIDSQAARTNEIIGNRISALEQAAGKWVYRAADTLDEALDGADFVIISILPGTFTEMQSDVHAPERYGIYQSVGDTVGPGGLVRSLRTVPMFQAFAEAVRRYAPGAWVINYTNPMAVCVRTLYESFPSIKAFGCCHEVFGTQKLLASMLEDLLGIEGVGRSEIDTNVAGLNHFTWITAASYHDMDLYPLYADFVGKYYEQGYTRGAAGNWMNDMFASAHRVKFDLFSRYSCIAAAGDRHLAEFCPSWYLRDVETVRRWKFALTPVQWRMQDLKDRLEYSDKLASGQEPVEIEPSGEEGVAMMKALLGMGNMISNVNLPNRGQISNLPHDTVVETNALFACGRITPLLEGSLPDGVAALALPHALNQAMIIQAAQRRDSKLAFNAFLNEPMVRIDPDAAFELFTVMMNNTKEYLPGFDI